MSIRYISPSDASEIGASCHYLQLERWGVLLDAGIPISGAGGEGPPDFEVLKGKPLQAILISHAHLDHAGALPLAIEHFPHARVYMTPATSELTEKMLAHLLQVQKKKAREARKPFLPFYSAELLEQMRMLFQSFDYQVVFPLHGYDARELQFEFWDAGHILGSAGIFIHWRGKRIFYTGDTRKSRQLILPGGKYPKKVDILIIESTYGADADAESIKLRQETKRFATAVTEVARFGGVILIPVFALGRTQEILALIHKLRMKNRIPPIPIFVKGFGLEINETYDRLLHKIYPNYSRRSLQQIIFGRLGNRRTLKGPAILVTTSGMMYPNSPSFELAREVVTDFRNAIFFVGYADPETPASLLQQKGNAQKEALLQFPEVHCKVERFYFSAHANRRELLEIISRANPKTLLLVHGSREAREWLANKASEILPKARLIIPEPKTWYTLEED